MESVPQRNNQSSMQDAPTGSTLPVLPYVDPTAVETSPRSVRVDATPALKLAALTTAGLCCVATDSPELLA